MSNGKLNEDEMKRFVSGLTRFIQNAKLSARGAAKVLGMSAPTIIRWQTNEKMGAYRWAASDAAKKIRVLNKLHKTENLYTRVANMPPTEKVATLEIELRKAEQRGIV